MEDIQSRELCRKAIAQAWTHFSIKVGADREDGTRPCAIIREEIGSRKLMMDANQRWDVGDAIALSRRVEWFFGIEDLGRRRHLERAR